MKLTDKYNFKFSLIILILYSTVLLCSEVLYRYVFAIPPITRYLESFIVLFILLSLYYFSKFKVTRILIVGFYFLSIVINNVHFQVYQSWINGTNYFLMLTEVSEVAHTGFAMYKQWILNLIWGVVDVAIFVSISRFRRKNWAIADTLFILSMIYIFIRSYHTSQELGISPNANYSRVKANYFSFGYFIGRVLPYHTLSLSDIPEYSYPKPAVKSALEIKNIIFIMGESESASHVSYFGYARETTPFFSKLAQQHPDAIIKQSYSAGFMTAVSLPLFFNAIPYPNGMLQMMKGDTNLFNLAKQQHYQTYFYSSQPENQMMIMNLIGKAWIDTLRFPTDEGYKISELMPDKNLLPHLYNINLDQGHNFVVLHQRGSHGVYGESLTEDEKIFKGKTPLDEYDNTIYNTDRIIEQVYHYLSQREQQDWLLVYTSDHGQNVTSKYQNQGTQAEANYVVPLMLFTPNVALQQKITTIFQQCKVAYHQQLSTLLINLMGYDMPISTCEQGVVTGNFVTGDAGYLKIYPDGHSEYIYPTKGRIKN
ncbi:phosphoethanolamine transferase [Gallibacterium trehalosifermentans]|uniref:Phosphoethanolamine transferase n=1 Tax=Gallibacterium trehalosifermentans TaxID=516935 RepID=A0ABV6H211_9PAST